MKIYEAFIFPHLNSSAGLWHFCSMRTSNLRELTKQDGRKVTKKCGARLCIPYLTRHFFFILPT